MANRVRLQILATNSTNRGSDSDSFTIEFSIYIRQNENYFAPFGGGSSSLKTSFPFFIMANNKKLENHFLEKSFFPNQTLPKCFLAHKIEHNLQPYVLTVRIQSDMDL